MPSEGRFAFVAKVGYLLAKAMFNDRVPAIATSLYYTGFSMGVHIANLAAEITLKQLGQQPAFCFYWDPAGNIIRRR